jgi:hypothetical protein
MTDLARQGGIPRTKRASRAYLGRSADTSRNTPWADWK